jgi:hypothetical protein
VGVVQPQKLMESAGIAPADLTMPNGEIFINEFAKELASAITVRARSAVLFAPNEELLKDMLKEEAAGANISVETLLAELLPQWKDCEGNIYFQSVGENSQHHQGCVVGVTVVDGSVRLQPHKGRWMSPAEVEEIERALSKLLREGRPKMHTFMMSCYFIEFNSKPLILEFCRARLADRAEADVGNPPSRPRGGRINRNNGGLIAYQFDVLQVRARRVLEQGPGQQLRRVILGPAGPAETHESTNGGSAFRLGYCNIVIELLPTGTRTEVRTDEEGDLVLCDFVP